jgi:hypothetical protein
LVGETDAVSQPDAGLVASATGANRLLVLHESGVLASPGKGIGIVRTGIRVPRSTSPTPAVCVTN